MYGYGLFSAHLVSIRRDIVQNDLHSVGRYNQADEDSEYRSPLIFITCPAGTPSYYLGTHLAVGYCPDFVLVKYGECQKPAIWNMLLKSRGMDSSLGLRLDESLSRQTFNALCKTDTQATRCRITKILVLNLRAYFKCIGDNSHRDWRVGQLHSKNWGPKVGHIGIGLASKTPFVSTV